MNWNDALSALDLLNIAQLVAAAGLGFLGGWGAVVLDRRRWVREVELTKEAALALEIEQGKEADWAVTWLRGDTWVLTNTGTAKAHAVDLQLEQFELQRSNVRNPMYESEEASFIGSPTGVGAAALISWTNKRNERMGPVKRAIPLKNHPTISGDDAAYRASTLRAANQSRSLAAKTGKVSYHHAPRGAGGKPRFPSRKGEGDMR